MPMMTTTINSSISVNPFRVIGTLLGWLQGQPDPSKGNYPANCGPFINAIAAMHYGCMNARLTNICNAFCEPLGKMPVVSAAAHLAGQYCRTEWYSELNSAATCNVQ